MSGSPSKIFGYARVSTSGQHTDRQIVRLKQYVLDPLNIYADTISGKVSHKLRPQYQVLVRQLRKGDTLYITELDRLGRTYKDIKSEVNRLIDLGVKLRILELPTTMEDIGSTDSAVSDTIQNLINNLLIEILASLSQAELEKNKVRQKEGIEQARLRGVKFGRPKIDIEKELLDSVMNEWLEKKIKAVEAMKKLNISKTKFYSLAKEYK